MEVLQWRYLFSREQAVGKQHSMDFQSAYIATKRWNGTKEEYITISSGFRCCEVISRPVLPGDIVGIELLLVGEGFEMRLNGQGYNRGRLIRIVLAYASFIHLEFSEVSNVCTLL